MTYYQYEIVIECANEAEAADTRDSLAYVLFSYGVKVEVRGSKVSVVGNSPLERATEVMSLCEEYPKHAIYMTAHDKLRGLTVSVG